MSIQEIVAANLVSASLAIPVHRFSVGEYHRLAESGFFAPDARVELLDGWIVDMTPIGIGHRFSVQEVYKIVLKALPAGWDAFMQQPVTLATSEPQPDIAIVRGANSDYQDRHPGAADVGLIIEVADSSLAVDHSKQSIYAAEGIPRSWIVDLVHRQVECHSAPTTERAGKPAAYDRSEIIGAAGLLPLILDENQVGTINVADILPKTDATHGHGG